MGRIENSIRSAIADLVAERDVTVTHWTYLGKTFDYAGIEDEVAEKRWCAVLAWQDGFENDCSEYKYGTYRICCKIAYQNTNSMLQDYDIDWLMPVDEYGDVDDTETHLEGEFGIDYLVEWIMENWYRIEKQYNIV